MAYPILGTPVPAFFDSSGDPLVAGTITTLNPSNDAVKASYPTAADADASTNGTSGDITLDARGEPTSTQYWGKDSEDYKVVIKDSAGSTIRTMDKIRMPAANRRPLVTFSSGDATPTVAEGNMFRTAGTTAITDFHDGEVGDIIVVQAASTITITDGTPINLAGNVNFDMVSGDVLVLAMVFDQKWYEVSRTVEAEALLTAGTGITTGTGTLFKTSIERVGTIIKTSILVDLTGLHSTAADDIIGVDGTALDCHLGQITAAKSGTIIGGTIKCLETPATGDPDINVYANVESTGSESDDPSGLTGTGILVNTGDHSVGSEDYFTAFPAANEYLYLVAGAATDADYTAGRLLIELYGY